MGRELTIDVVPISMTSCLFTSEAAVYVFDKLPSIPNHCYLGMHICELA
jgi:hypothetical protein